MDGEKTCVVEQRWRQQRHLWRGWGGEMEEGDWEEGEMEEGEKEEGEKEEGGEQEVKWKDGRREGCWDRGIERRSGKLERQGGLEGRLEGWRGEKEGRWRDRGR